MFLAVSALVAIRMDPTQLGNSPAAYGLLGFYMGNSILVLMLLRRRKASTARFRILVHAADIVWPAFISVFGDGPQKPVLPVFCFRADCGGLSVGFVGDVEHGWGGSGVAVGERASCCCMYGRRAGEVYRGIFSPACRINTTEFEPKRLFMLSVYLLVMGLLLGYLAEQQKHLRAEKAAVTSMLAKVRVESGLTGTLQQIGREVVGHVRSGAGAGGLAGDSQPAELFWASCGTRMRGLLILCGWIPGRGRRRAIWRIFRERRFTPRTKASVGL